MIDSSSRASPKASPNIPPPPIFGVSHKRKSEKNVLHNLDDIFDDFIFSVDRGVANTSEDSTLLRKNNESTYDDDEDDEEYDDYSGEDSGYDSDSFLGPKKKKRFRIQHRNMTEEQKVERRFFQIIHQVNN